MKIYTKFNTRDIEERLEQLKNKQVFYVIGTDTYDRDSSAYCLMRCMENEAPEILLSKVRYDKEKFDEEVINLSNYFNATIIGEGGETIKHNWKKKVREEIREYINMLIEEGVCIYDINLLREFKEFIDKDKYE